MWIVKMVFWIVSRCDRLIVLVMRDWRFWFWVLLDFEDVILLSSLLILVMRVFMMVEVFFWSFLLVFFWRMVRVRECYWDIILGEVVCGW